MARKKKLLLLLKPFDMYPIRQLKEIARVSDSRIFQHLDNRCSVHKGAVTFCQHILQRKSVVWEQMLRSELKHPIRNFDLVVTVGGDGTLLQASHFMDGSIPVLGVNSDPTQTEEVEKFSEDFDATRSTGYLCAATAKNFEQVLDDILGGEKAPSKLSRISMVKNSKLLPKYALNDLLFAHPCPAAVSRFSFKIQKNGESCTPSAHCRSGGLRVSTAAGSTAAMLSAGGFAMPISSNELQYMVREPISPGKVVASLMYGVIKPDQSMEVTWTSKEGVVYTDGSHVSYPLQYGDKIEISSSAPSLKVFLPCRTGDQQSPCSIKTTYQVASHLGFFVLPPEYRRKIEDRVLVANRSSKPQIEKC